MLQSTSSEAAACWQPLLLLITHTHTHAHTRTRKPTSKDKMPTPYRTVGRVLIYLPYFFAICSQCTARARPHTHTHKHTHVRLTALCPGLPRWGSNRKVKPIWTLLKQETVRGSGISWATCKSAPRQYPTTQFFTGRMPFLPPNQQRQSTGGTWYIHTHIHKHAVQPWN